MCYDVLSEDIDVLVEFRAEILAEFLDIALEVLVDVGLEPADAVVVLYEASACCLFHDVEDVLAVAHAE